MSNLNAFYSFLAISMSVSYFCLQMIMNVMKDQTLGRHLPLIHTLHICSHTVLCVCVCVCACVRVCVCVCVCFPESPKVRVTPASPVDLRVGGALSLECHATGKPRPTITSSRQSGTHE